jgi:hypothetical protein
MLRGEFYKKSSSLKTCVAEAIASFCFDTDCRSKIGGLKSEGLHPSSLPRYPRTEPGSPGKLTAPIVEVMFGMNLTERLWDAKVGY